MSLRIMLRVIQHFSYLFDRIGLVPFPNAGICTLFQQEATSLNLSILNRKLERCLVMPTTNVVDYSASLEQDRYHGDAAKPGSHMQWRLVIDVSEVRVCPGFQQHAHLFYFSHLNLNHQLRLPILVLVVEQALRRMSAEIAKHSGRTRWLPQKAHNLNRTDQMPEPLACECLQRVIIHVNAVARHRCRQGNSYAHLWKRGQTQSLVGGLIAQKSCF